MITPDATTAPSSKRPTRPSVASRSSSGTSRRTTQTPINRGSASGDRSIVDTSAFDSNPVQRYKTNRISVSSPVGYSGYRRTRPTGVPGAKNRYGLGLKGLVSPIPDGGVQMFQSGLGDFGPRPIGQGYHTGIDMSNPLGTPIRAVAGGIVANTNAMDSIYGNQVILDHGSDENTMYGHMAKYLVEPGERVKRGQVIGYVGSTGNSSGPHLHFETWRQGEPVNPLEYLREDNMLANMQQASVDPETRTRMENRKRAARNAMSNEVTRMEGSQEYGAAPSSNSPYLPKQQAVSAAPAVGQQQQQYGGNPQLQAFLNAIATQESGSNYDAVGVPTRSGTAYGKYQILDSNFVNPGGWDFEALDRDITLEQYLRTPQFQEKIARTKLRDYFKQFGPEGAAKAWYAGPGNADLNSNAPQYGGPSVNDYAASVLKLMMENLSERSQ